MKRFLPKLFSSFIVLLFILSCSDTDSEDTYVPVTGVVFDVNKEPLAKLSDYRFFLGDIKLQNPNLNVLPYEPASGLFSDYALKKRFIWMPANMKATYSADGKVYDFPVGTVLIKTFYYKTIQPNDQTKIIETRLMIKKSEGWIFAEYVWNDEQTDANLLDADAFVDGTSKSITFKKPNNDIVTVDYRIHSKAECFTCHKTNEIATPIGLKPQNLNTNYAYSEGTKNQLQKLLEQGYIDSYPANVNAVVDYRDTSKSLEIRARSYLDINCAHCHQAQGRCSYAKVRFGFDETSDPLKLGVCVIADEEQSQTLTKIITPGNVFKSILHFRINTNIQNKRMPLLGRTVIHDEGVKLIEDWISSLSEPCN
jgi:uncharacterized repeat protein (TIGR03806 family)